MAKFKNQDLILDDNEQVIFGDGNDASIYWDSSDLIVNQVFKHSTQGYYATRAFVESTVAGLEWQDAVLSKVTDTPVSPNYGDRYIAPSGASGAWSGYDDYITEYTTTWVFTTPSAGFSCWVEDEGVYYIYNGSTWIKFGGVVDHGNLLGLSDDDHTQYVLADGSRALSSDWDAGANKISCTGITARSASAVYLRRNAADLGILINTDGQTSIESTCFFQGDAYLGDNKRLTFGAGYDNTIVYSTTTDTLQVLDGNVTNTNVIAHFSSNGLWLTTGNATFSNDVSAVGNVSASAFYGDGSGVTGSDHGSLTGLSDDDHTIYYHVDGRRSWSGTLTVESTGSIITFKEDLAYIGVLNDTDLLTLSPGDVYIDGDLTITGTLSGDHSTLFNLDADDHTQYHNDTRGDARYYTQTQLNNGQLDSRYYTETELNNGQLDSRYYTEAETLSLTQGASANAYNNAVDYTDTEIATVTSLTLEASANAYDAATDWVTAQSYLQSIVTDTSPQLGGNLDLNGKNIDYGAILSTNGTYEGKIMTVTVDDASSAFGLVLAQAADFHYDRADADAATSSVGIVMALESGSGSKSVLIEGQICDTSWSWSAGFLYVSTAIGEMTQTPPSGTGDQVIAIGWALSATCIYFKPSLVLVEIA